MNPGQTTLQQANGLLETMESIQSALSQKITQKKMLKEKAIVAKNQIQDDISFHLELLRNREVWLLEQVNIHAQIKEELFESHINELSIWLAKLEAYQELLEASELKETEAIASQAMKIISSLKDEVVHAEETLGICFSADNFALSDALKNFGNIVEGEPEEKPRVHEKKLASRDSSVVFIQEHFKRVLSLPPKDWLIAGSEAKKARKDFGIVWKFYEELQKSDTKEWLYKQRQPMDLETLSNRFSNHFQQVKATPTTDWLQSGIVHDVDPCLPEGHTTLDTSENIKAWLLRPLEGLSLSSKGEEMVDEGISMYRYCVEGKNPRMGEKYIDGKNEWLLKEKSIEGCVFPGDQLGGYTTCQPREALYGSWLQRFRESKGSSTSDWLIVSEGEAEPDYCEWLTQESIDCCKRCPGDSECPKDTFNVFRNVLNSSKSEWLATASDW